MNTTTAQKSLAATALLDLPIGIIAGFFTGDVITSWLGFTNRTSPADATFGVLLYWAFLKWRANSMSNAATLARAEENEHSPDKATTARCQQ